MFCDAINKCGFIDLGSLVCPFTLCNYQNGEMVVWQRLDHGLAMVDCVAKYPEAWVYHLLCALWINFGLEGSSLKRYKPF